MEYSIIYALLQPEINERISLGLIIVDRDNIEIQYSEQKLSALSGLCSIEKQEFITKVVKSLQEDGSIRSVSDIDYLSRYSNNLLSLSPLQTIDLEPTIANKQSLFRRYIYSNS